MAVNILTSVSTIITSINVKPFLLQVQLKQAFKADCPLLPVVVQFLELPGE